jgi:hypothetical protein
MVFQMISFSFYVYVCVSLSLTICLEYLSPRTAMQMAAPPRKEKEKKAKQTLTCGAQRAKKQ